MYMYPTTSAGSHKQTLSMTMFLPQRLGLQNFCGSPDSASARENGLALAAIRPDPNFPSALPPTSLALSLGFNVDTLGACEIVSLREANGPNCPKRNIRGCAGCSICAPVLRVTSRRQQPSTPTNANVMGASSVTSMFTNIMSAIIIRLL
jgi:hypothetical protein